MIWKNRPLFSVAGAFIGSALISFFLIGRVKHILCATFLLAALVLLITCIVFSLKKQRKRVVTTGFAMCLFLASAVALLQSYLCIDKASASVAHYEGQSCDVVATVLESKGAGGQISTYTVELSTVNDQPTDVRALLTCYYIADFKPGHTIRLQAELCSLDSAAGDVYETYRLMGDSILCGLVSLQESDYHILNETATSLLARISLHRHTLAEDFEIRFGSDAQGLPSALFLGDRSHLSDQVTRDFSRTGVSHLLAISGLHMTLLFGLLAVIFKFMGIPPRIRAVLLGAGALVYLIYLGFPPSATRAIFMLSMTYLASLCFTSADPLTSLGVAGVFILAVSPLSVADMGFWLSFFSTFGLLAVLPYVSPSPEKSGGTAVKVRKMTLGKLLSGLAAGAVAVTFTLWITAPLIGEVSLLSAPMTLLLTPLVAAILLLVPLSLLTASTPLGAWISELVCRISTLITQICALCAQPSGVVISLRHKAIPFIALAMMLALLVFLSIPLKKKRVLLIPMLAGWILIGGIIGVQSFQTRNDLKISYLIPSSTSEMLVVTGGHQAVIIELSNGSRSSFYAAMDEACAMGATEISVFMLTDYHSRTSGALLMLLEKETVRSLWMPVPTSEEDYYLMLSCLEMAERTGTPTVLYEHGEELTVFGSATVTLQRDMLERSAQPVLLMTLETPTESLVICGRSIQESELSLPASLAMADSDIVIFSNKGPTLKEPIAYVASGKSGTLCFADRRVAAYLSPENYPEHDTTVIIGQMRFVMSRS